MYSHVQFCRAGKRDHLRHANETGRTEQGLRAFLKSPQLVRGSALLLDRLTSWNTFGTVPSIPQIQVQRWMLTTHQDFV